MHNNIDYMSEKIAKDFYERIKNLCKEKSITQIELCEKTDINLQSHKNRIVRNVLPDSFDSFKIAQYLNTTVEYLVNGTESQDSNKSEKMIEEITKVLEKYK